MPLIVRREARIFPRQNAAIISGELLEQVHILVIHRFDGEVDFGLWTGRPLFHGTGTATAFSVLAVFVRLARHMDYLISR